VSWVGVPRLTSGGPYTFQVLIYPSGTIDYQYLDMQGTRLNESTVGIQNATRDVGLQVAFNAAYVHDNLRVRITNQPGWLTVAPLSGTTPAGECDTLLVSFDATGLADGDYTGSIRISSNDLDEPLVTVPAELHVGVATATLDISPNTLNKSSNGNWVQGQITPPAGFTGHDIDLETVLLQRAVPVAPGAPVSYDDPMVAVKFSRSATQAVLPVGESVEVEVIGRVDDATWFVATDHVRVIRPKLASASATGGMPGMVFSSTPIPLTFEDPVDHTAAYFELWYSPDGGATWSQIAGPLYSRQYSWEAPSEVATDALLELVAYDGEGLLGSFLSNAFAIQSGTLDAGDEPKPERLALRFTGRSPAPRADLQLGLPSASQVSVRVYDVQGALVRELASGTYAAGWHHVRWDGIGTSGSVAKPGVYFVQANANGDRTLQRFVLLK
jgi:hypothetical protein